MNQLTLTKDELFAVITKALASKLPEGHEVTELTFKQSGKLVITTNPADM